MTNPEEHPAAREFHLWDWIRLLRHSAVLAFELRERYRLCARTVLETGEVATCLDRVEDPQLRQVSQVGQLYGHTRTTNNVSQPARLLFARVRTGLPSVQSSQSRIPITRFSVGWKMRLSSL